MNQEANAETPELSVVIPTRNRPDSLRDCLIAVRDAAGTRAVETLVMDQSDNDATRDVVTAMNDARFTWHRMPRLGACPARNFGAALARAPLVAFLDDDCCPRTDWVERIVAAFRSEPELCFVFGQLKAPENADTTKGWYPEFLPSSEWQEGRARRRVAMVAAGANMIARKSFLFELGGFDELLGPSNPTVKSNDSSISYKVFRSKRTWRADPSIEVIHRHGFRPHEAFARLMREYDHGLGVNWARFARRGDLWAVAYFWLEQWEMTTPLLRQLGKLQKPRGLKNWLAHLQGFWDGIRLDANVGYVSGSELRRMAETRRLDP